MAILIAAELFTLWFAISTLSSVRALVGEWLAGLATKNCVNGGSLKPLMSSQSMVFVTRGRPVACVSYSPRLSEKLILLIHCSDRDRSRRILG